MQAKLKSRPRQVTGWRKWVYRLLAVTVIPSLFVLLLEGSLRVCGLGEPTGFFVKIGGRDAYVTNPRFGWRFFPPAMARTPVVCELPAEKTEGTYRIFVLGGSAAQGDPAPAFGFGRMLAAMLQEQFPRTRFEVINAAMVAINSHVVLPIARDCTRHQPDLFVVYMGNNEVVGPYGSGTVFSGFSPHLSLIRTSIFLRSTRTGQLIHKTLGAHDVPTEWASISMFLEHRVALDDPKMEKVYSHFRTNLTDVCDAACGSGAKIIVCTVATNLKDSAPFASLHRPDLTEPDREKWERICDAAVASAEAGRHADAVERFLEAAKIDDRMAELHFRLGRCQLVLERFDEARRRFTLARDLDALRLRADTRINQAIREVTSEYAHEGVYLVDAQRTFEQSEQTQHRIPGQELFFEYVHMNPAGNYLLAKAVFEQIVALLPQSVRHGAQAVAAPSRDRCFELIALTDSDRYQMQHEISEGLRVAPFSSQLDAAQRQLRQEKLLAELRAAGTSPHALRKARQWYAAAIERTPDDPQLRREFAQFLRRHGDYEAAQRQWRTLLKRFPYVAVWHLEFGKFLKDQGKLSEAITEFRETMRLDPSLAGLAYVDMCSALEKEGSPAEAERVHREALAFDSKLAPVHNGLGVILYQQVRIEEAIQHFHQALKINPDLPVPRVNLAIIFKEQGNLPKAIKNYRQLLQIEPDNVAARHDLGLLLATVGETSEAVGEYRRSSSSNPTTSRPWPRWPGFLPPAKIPNGETARRPYESWNRPAGKPDTRTRRFWTRWRWPTPRPVNLTRPSPPPAGPFGWPTRKGTVLWPTASGKASRCTSKPSPVGSDRAKKGVREPHQPSSMKSSQLPRSCR